MRILHVPHAYAPALGGAELHCRRVSEELAKRGHAVRVVTTDLRGVEDYFRLSSDRVRPLRDRIGGIDVVRVPFGGLPAQVTARVVGAIPSEPVTRRVAARVLRAWRHALVDAFARELDAHAPDVVMTMPHLLPNVEAVLDVHRRRSFPLVMLPMLHERDPHWPLERMANALRQASAVIANTDHEVTRLREAYGVPGDRIHLSWLGTDLPATVSTAARPPEVLYVGRKTPEKGVGRLVAAMQRVWREVPDATLVLAGARSPATAEIDRILASLPTEARARVRSPDDVTDAQKQELLARARCFVLPSEVESFGIANLEAWAAGTPIVTYDIPVFRSYVTPNVDGLLVPPGDDAALAAAITTLLRDPVLAGRLGARGRAVVEERFHWPAVAERHERAYEQAIARAPREVSDRAAQA